MGQDRSHRDGHLNSFGSLQGTPLVKTEFHSPTPMCLSIAFVGGGDNFRHFQGESFGLEDFTKRKLAAAKPIATLRRRFQPLAFYFWIFSHHPSCF